MLNILRERELRCLHPDQLSAVMYQLQRAHTHRRRMFCDPCLGFLSLVFPVCVHAYACVCALVSTSTCVCMHMCVNAPARVEGRGQVLPLVTHCLPSSLYTYVMVCVPAHVHAGTRGGQWSLSCAFLNPSPPQCLGLVSH